MIEQMTYVFEDRTHVLHTKSGLFIFYTQEKMFFNNKAPSSCDYIVVNLCRWYQMKVFLHEYYVA